MESSTTYLHWFRRLLILGAVIGVGVFASTAGAVGPPPDVQDVAASLSTTVNRPPDIQDLATRISTSTADVFERYAAAHPYGAGLSASDTVVSRPPDVGDVASQLSAGTAGVFSRPPDVQDTAQALQNSSSGDLTQGGFDWNDWGIGIGTGAGLALILAAALLMGRQLRHRGMQTA